MVIGEPVGPATNRSTARRQWFGGLGSSLILTALAVLAALPVARWYSVLIWAAVTLGAVWLEAWHDRRVERPGWKALALTLLTSSLYALAAFVLMVRGEASARLFSFALVAVCMVHVLLRRYQTPGIFLVGLAPHMGLLALVGVTLTRSALDRGEHLGAVTPAAVLMLFSALFWAARRQLADSWAALSAAKVEAQERERAAEAANQAKSRFLATMSHEIRTPLNGVLGMAQAMAADDLSADQRARLRVVRRSGETLLAVLDDILDLSKIEACKLELEIAEFDMAHMVRGVVAAYTPLAQGKGLTFAFTIAPEAEGVYRGDKTRLRQILYNLTANAVKFTEAGSVNLTIGREDQDVVFTVSDTGLGIAETDLPRLFESFYQADTSATRKYGGSGLGLTICRELVDMMEGGLNVESRPGEGSVFTVRIPLPRISDGTAPTTSTDMPVVQDGAPEIRVLAAEDNEVNQLVLKTLLKQAGVDPVIVGNGALAVEAWETGEWDVILMDIQMPEMDGVTAAWTIRNREAATGRRRTPIIALTANAMAHQRAEYEAAGMDDLVAKPIDIARLFEALDQALSADADEPAEARTA